MATNRPNPSLLASASHRDRVTVSLHNRYAVFADCDADTLADLKQYFAFQPPGYRFMPAYRNGMWDGFVCLLKRGRVASGLFLGMKSELEKNYSLTIEDHRSIPLFSKVISEDNSRPYQDQALASMISASGTGGIVLVATGAGKTRIAGFYFQHLKGAGLFIVDELTLLDQSRAELKDVLGEPVGIVGRSLFEPARITCATIQTLNRHRNDVRFQLWFASVEVIIIDEIHVAINKRNIDIIQTVKPLAVFGLTATLQTDKPEVNLPVMALAGPVIYRYPIQDGVAQGYLTRGRVCFVHFTDPLTGPAPGYWTKNPDYRPGGTLPQRVLVPANSRPARYRYHIALNKARNNCIEAIVREAIWRDRRVIVLVERINHLRKLSQRLEDIPHRVLSGNAELSGHSSLRLEAMRDMDAGRVKLILASRVFGKGVNVRVVDTIIDATGMPGRDSAIQRYGRGVRTSEGKTELLYVDISDRGAFTYTAKMREKALRETGARVSGIAWNDNPADVFNPQK